MTGNDNATWQPIHLEELQAILARDLAACSLEQREYFHRVRTAPARWRQDPWGMEGGGFWVVAVHGDRVLWYNDIEEGFNVSRFESPGEIPGDEYGCNQDRLCGALPRLQGEPGIRWGPPEPLAGV